MDPLNLKPRHPAPENVECWDDDEDLQGIEDFHLRTASTTTTTTTASNQPSHFRDSISSRLSVRSDAESNGGGEEDWQVLLPMDDEVSTTSAIASAKNAGIPIPSNVPSSALLGGTIKRLGGRKLKKVLGDDWSEDLELPRLEDGGLKLRQNEGMEFPESLRQISAAFAKKPSIVKPQATMSFKERMESAKAPDPDVHGLGTFRDEDFDDNFSGDVPTIKVAKNRSPKKAMNFIPTLPNKTKNVDDIEEGLEFPADGEPLRLSARKEIPKTPASQALDDFDMEWAEGSLGTRFGGTRRDGKSNRSSSIPALSPSVSSCHTEPESEDEGLDGLILPDGPIKFDEMLKKRMESASPDQADYSGEKHAARRAAAKEDFFAGIEIGDGDVFDSRKAKFNRNIKHKAARQTSPKRGSVAMTFHSGTQPAMTRIPKPQGQDRTRSKLEPVSETEGPVPIFQRPHSSGKGHSANPSLSNLPTPSTPSSSRVTGPSTPSRRGLLNKSSGEYLRNEPTTTSAQLLKSKRSMPALRSQQATARAVPNPRAPSRAEPSNRAAVPSRPKTPVDRSGAESSLGHGRKGPGPPLPFLPAGTSHSQSHHISIKTSRNFRRPTSSDSNEPGSINNRPISRLSNMPRPSTPTNSRSNIRKDLAPDSLTREAASKRHLIKPTRRRAFGDGTELEVFDDLPTSASLESKFVKQPVGRGAPKSALRTKLSQTQLPPSRMETPLPQTPSTPLSPTKQELTPRFARDTNASRIAREQRTGPVSSHPLRETISVTHLHPIRETASKNVHPRMDTAPLGTISSNWKAHIAAKGPASPNTTRTKRGRVPQKPQLIKPLGDQLSNPKSVKGMHWNPALFRWEGNENALATFDTALPDRVSPRSSPGIKPAPALITNVSATQGVQVVGGMVFDPQRMCWLKMAPQHGQNNSGSLSNPISPDTVDDDDDPFAGLEDLDDGKNTDRTGGSVDADGTMKSGGAEDEWLVGEEFDVGPEFVRRQRAEEEKWRRKVEGWIRHGREDEEWKWAIRDLVTK